MWIILVCVWGCFGDDPGAAARARGWRAEAAIAGFRLLHDGYQEEQQWARDLAIGQTDFSSEFEYIPFNVRFESQRECLRVLRQALPERPQRDPRWSLRVVHTADAVYWNGTWDRGSGIRYRDGAFACFQEGSVSS